MASNNEEASKIIMEIFGRNSDAYRSRTIGKIKHLSRLNEKIYDSKRDGLTDKGYMVAQGSLILYIYPLSNPDEGTYHILRKGSWLFSDVVSHLWRANLGLSLKNNDKLSSFYEFIDSEFQAKVFERPMAASLLFARKMESLSSLIVAKSMAEYHPKREPDKPGKAIETNLQYVKVICELLINCNKSEGEDWVITNAGPQHINLHTGLKLRSINDYIKELNKEGVLKRTKGGESKINVKKALALIEGKPYTSLYAATVIPKLRESYLYSK